MPGRCPSCDLPCFIRPLERALYLQGELRKRQEKETASGGPPFDLRQLPNFSAVLEDIRSLWNVGSIFRSSDAAGFQRLFLCGITGCPPRKEIAKTSLGAEESVAWSFHTGTLEVLPSLQEAGALIVALESSPSSEPLKQALCDGKLRAPLCLVVGNEVSGLSPETLSICDLICHLPMRGIKESLNVAVAFGIAAYMIAHDMPDA